MNLADYFGQLINRAFSSVREGAGTVMGAIDKVASGLVPKPEKREVVSPLASNYRPVLTQASQVAERYNPPLENYFRSQLGPAVRQSTNLQEYFPILQNLGLLRQREQELNRPGLADLLALQALFESTGGRASPNTFGVLPGGEGSGRSAAFSSIPEAIDYQLSPNVLGGGVGGSLDILGRTGEITPEEIVSLYANYDPHAAYLESLLDAYRQVRGL